MIRFLHMPRLYILLSTPLTLISLLGMVAPVFADVQPITITPSIGFSSLSQVINTLLSIAFFFGALACFGYIVLGAFKYVSAGDNSNAVSSARTTILNAVIGLILLGVVFVVFQLAIRFVPGLDSFFIISPSSGSPGGGGCPTCK